jgi:T5SS/PEP-CTERM-associated repeat protein
VAYSKTGDGYVGVDAIYAGRLFDGTVIITSGTYTVSTFDVGLPGTGNAATTATVTLAGGATDVTVEDSGNAGFMGTIDVGSYNSGGFGYLNILDGATLTSINEGYADQSGDIVGGYENVRIGYRAGSFGAATVSGTGSRLVASGAAARISVGRDGGTGELRIENGGFVGTFDLDIGSGDTPSTGTLVIDGAGSMLLASADYGFHGARSAGAQGYLDIGRGAAGRGFLTVSNGGTFTTRNVDGVSDFPILRFGQDNGSHGYGLVTGTGSALNITQIGAADAVNYFGQVGGASLYVGQGGQGVLTVADDARVYVTGDKARLEIAGGRYSGGVPDNTADQSRLVIQGGGDVLVDSQGYGGSGNGATLAIGGGRNADGQVIVDGPGSTLTVTSSTDLAGDYRSGDIVVGNQGTARLDVANGGTVDGRELHVAFGAHGLDGAGYVASTGGYLQAVYSASSGAVNITGGGRVTITGSDYAPYRGVRIADASGTTGTVNVDGAGSSLAARGGAGVIRVGNYGSGQLNLTNGGQANGFFVDVGRNDGGNGTLVVDGAGSKFTTSNAYGQFVANSAQAGFLRLGRNDGSYGKLQVTNGGQVDVKNQYGTTSDFPQIVVGRSYGATGVLEIDGAGSTVNVALYGASTDGYAPGSGYYYGPRVRLGQAGGEGLATVCNGGVLNITGEDAALRIGEGTGNAADPNSLSTLSIRTGGAVNVSSIGNEFGAHVEVGRREGANGALGIDGAGSILRVASANLDDIDQGGAAVFGASVVVGREGTGYLAVTNGGVIAIDGDDDAYPAFIVGRGNDEGSAAAYGYALVAGTGSTVSVSGTATAAGGTDSYGSAGTIRVGWHAGSTGYLVISDGGSVVNAADNALTQIAADTGSTGTVTIDGGSSLLDAGTWLTIGAGFDVSTGGILPAGGGDGSLMLVGGGRATAAEVAVGESGAITGDGTINGNVALLGGTLTPGAAPGAITINGAFSADAGAALMFRMDGFTAGQFGTVTVTGAAAIDLRALDIDFPTIGTSPAGTSAVLLAAGSLDITGFSTGNLLIGTFGAVPADAASTLNGQNQAFLVADTGAALVVEALGQDGGNPTGAVDFGALEAAGVDITTVNGFGTGTGGGFDGFALLGVTAISGTAGNDVIDMKTTSNVSIHGRGGKDTITGGAGDDLLDGGDDDDELRPGLGSDTVLLGAGNDTVFGSLEDLSGDLIGGLTAGDRIVITDGEFSIVTVRTGAGPRQVEIDSTGDGIADQFIYLDGDLAAFSFSGAAANGQTVLAIDAASTAQFDLTPGVTETGSFGNNFNGVTDADGVVEASFTGQGADLLLSFTAFDVDTASEVKVLLNGALLGFLAAGVNEGLSQHGFRIDAGQQIAGENILAFTQAQNPAWKWGVTDILLAAAPAADMALTPGVTETGSFGNNFNGVTDADGVVEASFTDQGADLLLSFTAFDVDTASEVKVLLNGALLGFLAAGVNEGLTEQSYSIAAADQLADNVIAFVQNDNVTYTWGVTDVLIIEDTLLA